MYNGAHYKTFDEAWGKAEAPKCIVSKEWREKADRKIKLKVMNHNYFNFSVYCEDFNTNFYPVRCNLGPIYSTQIGLWNSELPDVRMQKENDML